jgi:hypothetical protein
LATILAREDVGDCLEKLAEGGSYLCRETDQME